MNVAITRFFLGLSGNFLIKVKIFFEADFIKQTAEQFLDLKLDWI